MIVHENVLSFDASILHDLLGDLYDIKDVQVCPADVGIGFIRRPRIYHVMCLRGRSEFVANLGEMYKSITSSMRVADRQHLIERRVFHRGEPRPAITAHGSATCRSGNGGLDILAGSRAKGLD